MKRPNILVFFSDQQRWDTVGCYGQRLPLTPHLDRLAAEGVRFEHAFTCQPVCGPARAALQTGRYPTEVACPTNHCRLPAGERTLAHGLAEQGYETAYIGKWHLASCGPMGGPDDFRTRAVPPDRRGGYQDFWLASDVLEFTSHAYDGHMFDREGRRREFPPGRYRVDVLTDWAIEYLINRRRDRPFFLFLSYIEPHHQNDHFRFEGPKGSEERFADYDVPGDLALTGGDWRLQYPGYLGCVHALDEALGRLRTTLERLGEWENTLVVYTSDHGCHFRTRNSEYKRSCHDASIRIPMVIHGPGFGGGRVVSRIVSLVDLPPTILQAGGAPVPATMRGQPIQSLLDGRAATWPEEAFIQISESQCGRAIRTPRWTYSVRAPGKTGMELGSDVYEEEYLYDLSSDPHQRRNRVMDPSLSEVRTDLARRLRRWMQKVGEPEAEIRPAGRSAVSSS